MDPDKQLIALAKKRLRREHPGWYFWHDATGWHAYPRPLLSAAGEAEISEKVTDAHARPERHPALALVERAGTARVT